MAPLMQEILGRNLKALREERGLSKEALARELNIGWRTLSRWENGENAGKRLNLQKAADYFGVTINDLVSPSGGKNKSPKQQQAEITLIVMELQGRVNRLERKVNDHAKALDLKKDH